MADLAFRKSSRLLNSHDFKCVFEDAVYKVSHRHCLILARPNELDHPRLGLVIAKKNIRLAVQRNRVKRSIRETFRLKQHKLPNIDAIVLARSQLDTLSDKELHALFTKNWVRMIDKVKKQTTDNADKASSPHA